MARATYQGRAGLKAVGVGVEWTPHRIEELAKCENDIVYFCENYVKIVSKDLKTKKTALIPFVMRDYQQEMVKSFQENRSTITLMSRQSGKTEAVRGFVLHYVLFNPYKTVAIVANKEKTVKEILAKIKIAYQALPEWLQQGVKEWNKTSITLENESRIVVEATSPDVGRGYTIQCLVIDECAHVEHWDEFYASISETTQADPDAKMIMISTPLGLNHYYKFWIDAKAGKNDFNPIFVPWHRVPGRDEEWKRRRIADSSIEQFEQEHECEFLGSSNTLIAGWKLRQMVSQVPISIHEGLSQYELPLKDHKYAISCDVSHGKGLDYSAFHVVDVTEMPYRQVCVYHSNRVTATDYTQVIYQAAVNYNSALVLVETNDIGAQVAEDLHYDMEYENIVFTASDGTNKKTIINGLGFGNKTPERGVRVTQPIKLIGCSLIKLLIEQNQLIINHQATIEEFATFSKKNKSYEAEEGKHDDLVMPLVLFGWMSAQAYFKEYTDTDPMKFLRDKTEDQLYDELLPFGFLLRGETPENELRIINETDDLLAKFDLDAGFVRSLGGVGEKWEW
jgi:hypothetical protein